MENNNCNQPNSFVPYRDNCFNLESLSDVLRSPRVFDPVHALNNLQILKCGYVAVKAAVLNYLYQVSDIYEYINNSINLTTPELANLESKYKDVVNELLASITTSVNRKLSDCSKMIAYDLCWVDDVEEQDSNIDVTTAFLQSDIVTFASSTVNGVTTETATFSQTGTSVKRFEASGTIDQDARSITISQIGSSLWEPDLTYLTVRDVYYLYAADGTYKAVLYYASQTADTGGATPDETITLNFDNQTDISAFDDGEYIVTNWGPSNAGDPPAVLNKNYVYYLFDASNVSQALMYWQSTTGTFLNGDEQITFKIVKKATNVEVGTAPYETATVGGGTIWTVSGPSYNKLKVKMDDLPILAYKAFDVGFDNNSITTFCDRPSFQILGDRSTYSVVLRTATNSKWTPVGLDNYGRSGNTMYSQVSTKNAESVSYVLCPSTELRKKPDPNNINATPFQDEGIRYDGTAAPDVVDSDGNVTSTYRAFGNRNNAQVFLETILTPDTSAPGQPFDISENDLVYFLGFLDNKIRQTELVSNSVRTQLNIQKKICNN